jgi:hypothetical protein
MAQCQMASFRKQGGFLSVQTRWVLRSCLANGSGVVLAEGGWEASNRGGEGTSVVPNLVVGHEVGAGWKGSAHRAGSRSAAILAGSFGKPRSATEVSRACHRALLLREGARGVRWEAKQERSPRCGLTWAGFLHSQKRPLV